MILTCPECATRYSVADDSVGAGGRTVRCTGCGLTWRTERDPTLELGARATTAASPGLTVSGDDLPRAFRERIAAQRRGRKVAASGVLWAGVGVGAAALLLTLVLARDDVARAWPKSASAFAAVGLPVNSVGLEIQDQTARMGFTPAGQPTVLVTGRLRNLRDRPVTAPSLRFELLDGEEQVVATRIVRPLNAEIPAGQAPTFTVSLENPPESTHDVDIGFDLDGDRGAVSGAEPKAEPMKAAQLRPAHADAGPHTEAGH